METKAKLVCVFAGAAWGLFWIPLRLLEDAGMQGQWVTFVYFLVPWGCLFPIFLWRLGPMLRGGLDLQITALCAGVALSLYSMSIVYTEVVRAILLFYLTPIWSSLLARIVLGEPITRIRVVSMVVAFIGMLTIFGLGVGLPVPKNIGDWMGLASGLIWAVVAVRLRGGQNHNSIDITIGFFQYSLIIALGVALILAPGSGPTVGDITGTFLWLIPISLFIIIPGSLGSLWGPKFLNPGVVGLLFMSEIVVGAISAAILSGEPFGTREALGVLLIAGASLLEPIQDILRGRAARA